MQRQGTGSAASSNHKQQQSQQVLFADGLLRREHSADLEEVELKGADVAASLTQSNGYKYSVCGDGLKDASQLCCKAAEKCVQVKPFSGDDKVVCSEARQLTETKAVKIVIIPLFFMLLEVALIVYLVLRCKIKESPVTMLCVVVLAISWPFFFSKYWTFGAYTMLLATLVAVAAASGKGGSVYPKMPFWTYRLIWGLTIFQIIALLGPFEAFHVPIFGQSKTASNLELIKNVYSQSTCDSYYDSYFTILAIEKQAKEANPDETYGGYCAKNWLATVQAFGVIQAMVWMGLALVSGRDLLVMQDGDTAGLVKTA